MINASFEGSDQKIIEALGAKAPKITDALASKITFLMLMLQSKIVREKLQGQVLHQRTGKLAGSIVAYAAEMNGSSAEGRVEGASGPAWYGRIHELGGQGAYEIRPVNKKALAFIMGEAGASLRSGREVSKEGIGRLMQSTSAKNRTQGMRLFKKVAKAEFMAGSLLSSGSVVVKSVMHPPLPKRSFMVSTMEEERAYIVEELRKTLSEQVAL
jgi:hypothetical protein